MVSIWRNLIFTSSLVRSDGASAVTSASSVVGSLTMAGVQKEVVSPLGEFKNRGTYVCVGYFY